MATRTSPDRGDVFAEWISRFVADIPSAVALFDGERRYVAANHRWLNAFGIVGEAPIGQSHEQVDPHSAATFTDLHHRALAGETAEICLAEDDEMSEGATHRIVNARPYRGRDGTILGVVATLHEA